MTSARDDRPVRCAVLFRGAFCLLLTATGGLSAADQKGEEFFERRIRPVLVRECYSCHSAAATEVKGELRVDSRAAIRAGGETGPAVVPGRVNKSLLIDALEHRTLKMPPEKKLPRSIIADFRKWIEQGAPDPRDHPPTANKAAEQSWELVLTERRKWWSLQPVGRVSPPEVDGNDWSTRPVDRFVLAGLRQRQLTPAADADALTLLRRLSFVLTGLPPAPELVHSFPQRFARDAERSLAEVVDGLLESPHFGERMARHWMDVVRYTDTYGYEWDNPAKGSWEYRDYLIRAFNGDVGFDQLIREQVAGDLLHRPRIDRSSGLNESLIGPMFYHMGEHRHGDNVRINGVREEMVDNKIDAFSKAFLSMTIACARCHNHKLDAVSQRDYYAMAGMFMTPRWTSRSVEAPGQNRPLIDKLKGLRDRIAEELRKTWTHQGEKFASDIETALVRPPAQTDSQNPRLALWRKALGDSTAKKAKAADVASDFASATGLDGLKRLVSRLALAADDAAAETAWKQASEQWRQAHTQRKKKNRAIFKVLADVGRDGWPENWVVEGDGMRHGRVVDGTPLIALDGKAVVQTLLRRGFHTHSLSPKLPGAVRMPRQQDVPGKYVSLELAGGEWSGSIRMADNAFQTEAVKFFDWQQVRWESFADVAPKNGIQRFSYDLVTSDLNPNFPPRTGVARVGARKLSDKDTGFKKRSWFSVTGVVTHAEPGQPADELTRFSPLFDGLPPKTARAAFRQIGTWLATAVDDWVEGRADGDDVRVLNWLLEHGLLQNTAVTGSGLATLVEHYREAERAVPFARTVNSMDERAVVPVDYPLNIRGSIHDRGPNVPRRFLQVFGGQEIAGRRDGSGSGRLELARFLVDPRHALTARVYVNRIWQWVFGSGLVRTSNDFGRLGDRPSHPELLDYLARELIADGWSSKRMIRRLVSSRSFRQGGRPTEKAMVVDPDNRLLHHAATRRLEAEAIRDSLLAVSGRLDRTLFGRSINPHRHAEDSAKRLFSGPIDGNGRRSIYLKVSIMAPSKFLLSFNFPDPKLPTGRRDVTNVPAQALVLLNDPFVVSLADRWAARLVGEDHSTPEARIEQMFVRALGRSPRKEESGRWVELARGLSDGGTARLMTDRAAWKNVAHTLLNTKEFIHFR
ncbi:MAG TPA: hypothetical protein DER64_19940 [Planctomycetaceae bacterium]|nr:hypothetical protein [Planctomycetaceae bacterium]